MTRLNPQQHLKTAELLLAHRQHRHHGAPPRTPKPGRVSPLLCRGVSSLYCSYRPALAFLIEWKAKQKGRRSLVHRLSSALVRACAEKGVAVRLCPHTKTRL